MDDAWKGRKVLVTGANGFLASWLVQHLLEKGALIVSLIFAPNPVSVFEQERLEQKTETIFGDIMNFSLLQEIIKKYDIQTIFHLGAQAICVTAEENPLSTLDINIKGTYHILEAVRRVSPTTQVIVASSDKAYGTHEQLPYEEHYPLHGEYPYEVSKTCADLISTMYWRTYRLPICVVRCGNLYGGGDGHFSRLIPRTIKLAFQNESPVILSNTTRDFLYVEDAVRGYLSLAEKMREGAVLGEAFNFGTETPQSVTEVIDKILASMEKQHLRPQKSPETPFGIPHQYLSFQKAKRMLGWEPKVQFEEGLQRTIDWYVRYLEKTDPCMKPIETIYHTDTL